MRVTWCALALSLTAAPAAAQQPLAEKYLHSGELAKGEQALEKALAASPFNDRLRFGLGVIQFVRGVERLGQSLHEYGVKSENAVVPFLRLPVPRNPEPNSVRYRSVRRVLDDFHHDLAKAEQTLAGVTDDNVKLPLALGAVRLDLDEDGNQTDMLVGLIQTANGRKLQVLEDDPKLRVVFDRGDVAWLRAYCHLLMGMIDFMLAFDWEYEFNQHAKHVFAKPKPREIAKPGLFLTLYDFIKPVWAVAEPARLGRLRRHLLKVCELNRETWKFIRAETDDDREWLPNPRQKGVLGLPVRDEMIGAWLEAVAELEKVLTGEKLVPNPFPVKWGKDAVGINQEVGINLKTVLDDPPAEIDLDAIILRGVADKYLKKGNLADSRVLDRVAQVFDVPMGMVYVAWFN